MISHKSNLYKQKTRSQINKWHQIIIIIKQENDLKSRDNSKNRISTSIDNISIIVEEKETNTQDNNGEYGCI